MLIVAGAKSEEDIPEASERVRRALRRAHRLPAMTEDDFDVTTVQEMAEMANVLTGTMQALVAVIASISLVVGGVGIMNIMLVSVTERTREIGLRMAVGARGRHILGQFLMEAVVLCLLGGVAGILLGRGTSLTISALLGWPAVPSVSAILAALAVSGGVGIAFGYYPAWRASRLDPIVALHYE